MSGETTPAIDAIHEAFEREDVEGALARARDALSAPVPEADEAEIRLLAGVALLELGRPDEARRELLRCAEIRAGDADVLARLATACFRCCRFDEADAFSRRAVESGPGLAEAHEIRALVVERLGRFPEADRHFGRAHDLAPEDFPLPVRLSRREFEEEVVRAGDLLPREFRRHLADVATSVEDVPSEDVLRDGSPPLDPELLGLFVGVALPERSSLSPGGDLPPRILLFRRNLERYATDRRELREEIATTLYHELGHYLGFDEDQLEDLDLG